MYNIIYLYVNEYIIDRQCAFPVITHTNTNTYIYIYIYIYIYKIYIYI